MKLRGLLCSALLLAIPAMAQPDAVQAASEPSADVQPAASENPALPDAARGVHSRLASLGADRQAWMRGRKGLPHHHHQARRHSSVAVPQPQPRRGQCSFHVIARAHRDSVGDLAYLHGKIVAVVGDVTEYRGHPAIIVRDKEQLQVAAERSAAGI